MKGFRNVLRWSEGSMRISSRLTARNTPLSENANGYCFDSSMT